MQNPSEGRLRKSSVSTARRRLIETMQEVGFGRVEHLLVHASDPVWSPAPRVVRQIRLGKSDAPRSTPPAADFALRQEVVELFALFDSERDIHVESIEVQHGLPVRVAVATQGRP
jgi:hypothetical protein